MCKIFSKIFLPKLFLLTVIIISVGLIFGVIKSLKEIPRIAPSSAPQVNKIEISVDKKSIIDAETKKLLFKISEAQNYIKDYFKNRDYEYAPGKFIPIIDAKYAGDCFGDAVLSNDKELIVFSTSCIDDTTMDQPWIGTVNHKLLPLMYEGETAPESRKFLSGGFGQNFTWSSDDKTIAYETPSLFSLPTSLEKRIIDSKTGEILELKDMYHESTPSPYYWDTYQNYDYGFEVKYPSDWEQAIPTSLSIKKFINKPDTGNIDVLSLNFIEIKSENGYDWYEDVKKIADIKKRKINEQEFYFFKNLKNLNEGFLFNEYYTKRDNKFFSIVTGIVFKREGGVIMSPTEAEISEQQDIFNRILSSFKFIDKDLPFFCGTSIVTDIDGNIYKTVKIGNQCWLKENLRVTKNPAGEAVTRYCYNNDLKNCEADGGLYDWNTVMNKSIVEGSRGICPDGWHIPKDSEWYILENGLATNSCSGNKDKWDCDSAGTKLKIGGSSSFESILAGYRYPGGIYDDRGVYAKFWSSMEKGINAWYLFLYLGNSTVSQQAMDKRYGASVRCLKD